MRNSTSVAIAILIGLSACSKAVPSSPAIADPETDKAHPANNFAFTIPVESGAMNAMLYTAAGAGPHPTVLLLHGFPGNEQNLDLAQAARRAGWNVLTQHYRGSWGSPGSFSFEGAATDAHRALAFLEDPANAAKYGIDRNRIAIVGHSMGGMMAADAAADDRSVIGLFLIDPWDMSVDARALGTSEGAKAWHDELITDLPPLSGTDEASLTTELKNSVARFDLAKRLMAYGKRPLEILGAERGGGAPNATILKSVQATANPTATGETWPTDHSFNDRRIALSERLVEWLESLSKRH